MKKMKTLTILLTLLFLPFKAKAFIGLSQTLYSQEYEDYETQKIENGLSLNINYYKAISNDWIVGLSTNRLTSSFLESEGYLVRKDNQVAIKTKTRMTSDSFGIFRKVNKYMVGGSVINARKDSNLYLNNTKIGNNKESELLYGLSFGKILESGVFTVTYIFNNEDFNLKRAVNISYSFKK